MRYVSEKLFFFIQFFRDRQIASLIPTSNAAVRKSCKVHLPADRPVVIVEYGPGTGVFTKFLTEYLHPESHIVAIERNKELYQKVKEFAKTKKTGCKLTAVQGDAQDVATILNDLGLASVDFFLSGIPFSFLDKETKMLLLQETKTFMEDDGGFLVYQVSFHVYPYLKEVFPYVSRSIFWRNIPPLYVMFAKKKA